MSTVEFVISFLGGSAILLTAVSWLVKSLLTHWLAKDVEEYKSKIQFESQTELTRVKASIEKRAFEHQIIFSRLHDRRAKVIEDVYTTISNLYRAMKEFVKTSITDTEKRKTKLEGLWDAVDKFRDTYEPKKIFFNTSLCQKIEELNDTMSAPVSKIVVHLEMYEQNPDITPVFNAWKDAEKQIAEIVDGIMNELEDEFRKILGVQ